MWGGLVDYYHYTNDSSFNNVTATGLLSQTGPNDDYVVPAEAKSEGNDDQAFWGFALMSAAEKGFPAPPSGTPSWLQLTINLFNSQVARWDIGSCNGGLRWQIYEFNSGYDYKNSVSNGAFFQLATRLARYTGNQTYVEWANRSWDWATAVGLIDSDYRVYDGTDDKMNCSTVNHVQFSYGVGIYLYGAAVMYNYTNASSAWQTRTAGLLNASTAFFSPYPNSTDVMYEASCEKQVKCDTDQQSFKAYLSRFMWATTQMAPFTTPLISTVLRASAAGAAASCSGGNDGKSCGIHWYTDAWDGLAGVGQQLMALEVMQGLLINSTSPPTTMVKDLVATTTTSTPPSSSPTKKSEGLCSRRATLVGLLSATLICAMTILI